MIPKRMIFIWLGFSVPKFAHFAMQAFREVNPSFEVCLVHKTTKQLEDIYFGNCSNNIDQTVLECIQVILDKNKSTPYRSYIEHQRSIYGKHIKLVNILSDVLRIALLNDLGGIYLDCDCFPVKPFDDELLSKKWFCVDRHNTGSRGTSLDNYFIGAVQRCREDNNMLTSIFDKKCSKVFQSIPGWHSSTKFIYNKHKFFECKLQIGDWSLSKDFYIDHYNSNSWSKFSTVPSVVPATKLDNLLQK